MSSADSDEWANIESPSVVSMEVEDIELKESEETKTPASPRPKDRGSKTAEHDDMEIDEEQLSQGIKGISVIPKPNGSGLTIKVRGAPEPMDAEAQTGSANQMDYEPSPFSQGRNTRSAATALSAPSPLATETSNNTASKPLPPAATNDSAAPPSGNTTESVPAGSFNPKSEDTAPPRAQGFGHSGNVSKEIKQERKGQEDEDDGLDEDVILGLLDLLKKDIKAKWSVNPDYSDDDEDANEPDEPTLREVTRLPNKGGAPSAFLQTPAHRVWQAQWLQKRLKVARNDPIAFACYRPVQVVSGRIEKLKVTAANANAQYRDVAALEEEMAALTTDIDRVRRERAEHLRKGEVVKLTIQRLRTQLNNAEQRLRGHEIAAENAANFMENRQAMLTKKATQKEEATEAQHDLDYSRQLLRFLRRKCREYEGLYDAGQSVLIGLAQDEADINGFLANPSQSPHGPMAVFTRAKGRLDSLMDIVRSYERSGDTLVTFATDFEVKKEEENREGQRQRRQERQRQKEERRRQNEREKLERRLNGHVYSSRKSQRKRPRSAAIDCIDITASDNEDDRMDHGNRHYYDPSANSGHRGYGYDGSGHHYGNDNDYNHNRRYNHNNSSFMLASDYVPSPPTESELRHRRDFDQKPRTVARQYQDELDYAKAIRGYKWGHISAIPRQLSMADPIPMETPGCLTPSMHARALEGGPKTPYSWDNVGRNGWSMEGHQWIICEKFGWIIGQKRLHNVGTYTVDRPADAAHASAQRLIYKDKTLGFENPKPLMDRGLKHKYEFGHTVLHGAETTEVVPHRSSKLKCNDTRVTGLRCTLTMTHPDDGIRREADVLAPFRGLVTSIGDRFRNDYDTPRCCPRGWNYIVFTPCGGPLRWRVNAAWMPTWDGKKALLEVTHMQLLCGTGQFIRDCLGDKDECRENHQQFLAFHKAYIKEYGYGCERWIRIMEETAEERQNKRRHGKNSGNKRRCNYQDEWKRSKPRGH